MEVKMKHFAIYKGEEFLYEGTAKECAKYLNIKERTVYFISYPAYKKRIKNHKKAKIAILIDEEDK